jgi:hypothetical protein
MAQQKAAIPTITRFLCLFEKLRSQGPKRCSILNGLLSPKVRHTISQTSLAMGQSKNKCWIDSGIPQKQQLGHPFHFLFARLSLVNTTPFLRNHRKILIFNGNLAFQAPHSTGVPDVKTKLTYNSLTENFLLAVHTHSTGVPDVKTKLTYNSLTENFLLAVHTKGHSHLECDKPLVRDKAGKLPYDIKLRV